MTFSTGYSELAAPNGGTFYTVTGNVRLAANAGRLDDYFIHTSGQAFIYAGAGNDYIRSSAYDISYLFGQDGNDILIADDGRGKYLDGGVGNDILISSSRLSASNNNAVDTLVGGQGNDRFVVGEISADLVNNGFEDPWAAKAPQVRILLNDGDGHDVLTGSTAGELDAPLWYFALPKKPIVTPVELTEAQANRLEVNVNANNVTFNFRKLNNIDLALAPGDEGPSTIERFEVTLGYGTGINSLRYVERLQGDTSVDQINVGSGAFFTGQQVRNIYQAFTSYQASNPSVAIDTISSVRNNSELLQIIAQNSTSIA
ncbi:MAG: hypothetical protein ACKO37_09520 [Vampirovibrionales bacterium]